MEQIDKLKAMIDELNFKLENGTSTNYVHGTEEMSTREVEIYLTGQRNALINVYNDLTEKV